jgi:hypothetical protein
VSNPSNPATAPLTGRDGKPWPEPPSPHDAIAATTPSDVIMTALEAVHANPRPSDRDLLDAARSARAVAECAMSQAEAAHDAGNDERACQLGEHALALLFIESLYRDAADDGAKRLTRLATYETSLTFARRDPSSGQEKTNEHDPADARGC